MSCHVFFASVSASVLTTGLAGGGQAGCADRWAGFMTASVGNSVKTGDAAFRSVSVSPTFPTFTSSSLSDSVSENALACTSRTLLPCCDPACYAISQVSVSLIHLATTSPWPPRCPAFYQASWRLPFASVATRVKIVMRPSHPSVSRQLSGPSPLLDCQPACPSVPQPPPLHHPLCRKMIYNPNPKCLTLKV